MNGTIRAIRKLSQCTCFELKFKRQKYKHFPKSTDTGKKRRKNCIFDLPKCRVENDWSTIFENQTVYFTGKCTREIKANKNK